MMRPDNATTRFPCGRIARRTFLADVGMGFTGLALGAMLHRDGVAGTSRRLVASRRPAALRPEGQSVIWIFLSGGVSHLETLRPQAGAERSTPARPTTRPACPNPLKSPLFRERSRAVVGEDRDRHPEDLPAAGRLQEARPGGIEISDWWPHLASCVDDIAFVRSMYTTDNDHAAEFQMHPAGTSSTSSSRPSARGSTTAWAR